MECQDPADTEELQGVFQGLSGMFQPSPGGGGYGDCGQGKHPGIRPVTHPHKAQMIQQVLHGAADVHGIYRSGQYQKIAAGESLHNGCSVAAVGTVVLSPLDAGKAAGTEFRKIGRERDFPDIVRA